MQPKHNEACYIFGVVADRMFEQFSTISKTFRYISRSIDFAENQIIYEDVEDFRAHSLDPRFKRFFANGQEIEDGSFRQRVGDVVYNELQAAKRRAGSASLVFMHAIFEECVSDCLRVAFLAAPSDWLPVVNKKTVSLEDLSVSDLAHLQMKIIQEFINSLGRQSLMKKLGIFFQVVRPSDNLSRIHGYQYSQIRIEQLDQARHVAAHDDPVAYNPDKLEADVEYLRMTVMYLLAILIERYDVHNIQRPLVG
jgi:hypothetical protein